MRTRAPLGAARLQNVEEQPLVSQVRAAAVEQFGTPFETTPAFLSLRDALGRDPTPEVETLRASMASLEKWLRAAPDHDAFTRQKRHEAISLHITNAVTVVGVAGGVAGLVLMTLGVL